MDSKVSGRCDTWRDLSRRWLLTGGAAFLAVAPLRALAGEMGARGFIDDLGAETLAILSTANIGIAERRVRFRALFQQHFDAPSIGRFVLGRHWSRITPDEQARYLELVRDYVSTIYAVQFAGYQGVTFHTTGERQTSPGESLVPGQIDRSGLPPIHTGFRVVKTPDGYRVIDVSVEEVSLIITKRDEFSSVLTREGIGGVMQRMQVAIDAMQAVRS